MKLNFSANFQKYEKYKHHHNSPEKSSYSNKTIRQFRIAEHTRLGAKNIDGPFRNSKRNGSPSAPARNLITALSLFYTSYV